MAITPQYIALTPILGVPIAGYGKTSDGTYYPCAVVDSVSSNGTVPSGTRTPAYINIRTDVYQYSSFTRKPSIADYTYLYGGSASNKNYAIQKHLTALGRSEFAPMCETATGTTNPWSPGSPVYWYGYLLYIRNLQLFYFKINQNVDIVTGNVLFDADPYLNYWTGANPYWKLDGLTFVTEIPPTYGPESGPGGGPFAGDNVSDEIIIPSTPSVSAVDTGMVTMYTATTQQMQSLSAYLWSGAYLDNVPKLMSTPIDAILSATLQPVAPSGVTDTNVKIGTVSSGLTMTRIQSQYTTVDCGSINLAEYWGNALDFNPYTRIDIYLPYIGVRSLNADEIMGGGLTVKYNIDMLTGACDCFIYALRSYGQITPAYSLSGVLYHFTGNIATEIPITGSSMIDVYRNTLSAGLQTGISIAGGNVGGAIIGAANMVMGQKISTARSGAMGSAYGIMDRQKPYLIISRPVQSLPSNYPSVHGWPSNITAKLSDLTGYTVCEDFHLDGIPATASELDEIDAALRSGVIL